MDRPDPGELSSPLEDLVPLDPRQLIAERQQAHAKYVVRKADEREREQRRKKNKAARRARKNNR